MIYQHSDYSGLTFDRPTDDVDPKLKQSDPRYSLEYAKYIYTQYLQGHTAISSNDISRFKENLSYAQGRQDTSQYKNLILDEFKQENQGPNIPDAARGTVQPVRAKDTAKRGFINVDFDKIFSPIPKYLDNVVGIFDGMDHNVHAVAVDEYSENIRTTLKMKSLVKGMYQKRLAQVDAIMELEDPELAQNVFPKSVHELEMLDNSNGFKLPYEVGLTKAIDATLPENVNRELKKRTLQNLLIYGISATEDIINPVTKLVEPKFVNIFNLILEDSNEPDFNDITYYASVNYASIQNVKYETGLNDDQLLTLAQQFTGEFGNRDEYTGRLSNDGTKDFYSCKIPVMNAVWVSVDTEYRTTRFKKGKKYSVKEPYGRNHDGTSKLPRLYDNENRKTKSYSRQSLYKCKWIIGSEYVYDFGKLHGIGFDYKNKKVKLPIHAYKLPHEPMVRMMIPIENDIMLTYLRLQAGIAKAPPPGLAFEASAIENLSFSMGEGKWKPIDSIRLHSQTGYFAYKISPGDVDMPPNTGNPVTELRGGLGTVVTDSIRALELFYNQLMEITGIDRISSVSKSPSSEQTATATQLAVSATGNTLKPLYSAYLSIKESLAKSVAFRIQGMIYMGDNPYQNIIGDSAYVALKTAGATPPIMFGVKLFAMPDKELKEEIRAAAQAALAGGKNGIPALTYSEYLFIIKNLITTYSGIEFARMYIAKKESEKEERDAEKARQMQKDAIEQSSQQSKEKAALENQKIELEKTKELEILKEKATQERETEKMKHEYKLEQIKLEKQYSEKN